MSHRILDVRVLTTSQSPGKIYIFSVEDVTLHIRHSDKQRWSVSVDLIFLKKIHPDVLRYFVLSAIQVQHRRSLQTVLCGTWQTPPEASFEKGYLVCPLSYFRSASLSGLASLWKYSSLTLPPPLSLPSNVCHDITNIRYPKQTAVNGRLFNKHY